MGSSVGIADSVTDARNSASQHHLTQCSPNAEDSGRANEELQELWTFTFANVEGDECGASPGDACSLGWDC